VGLCLLVGERRCLREAYKAAYSSFSSEDGDVGRRIGARRDVWLPTCVGRIRLFARLDDCEDSIALNEQEICAIQRKKHSNQVWSKQAIESASAELLES
jgi:hypothetical protein